MKYFLTIVGTLCLLSACATQKPAPAPTTEAPKQHAAFPQMSEKEMMEKFVQSATPGKAHAELQPLIGQWNTTVKVWKEPGQDPEITKGSANYQWVLGNRFVKTDYKGTFMNQPFQGFGTIGYDNVKKEYISTWMDSMSTGMMTSEGHFNPATKSIEMAGKFSCPITDSEMHARTVTRIIDKNNHVFEMYGPTPDGKEYKSMEITYKRKA